MLLNTLRNLRMETKLMATNFIATILKLPQFRAMKLQRKYFHVSVRVETYKAKKTGTWVKGQALEVKG